MMLEDPEVGKLSSQVPVLVSSAIEQFASELIHKSSKLATAEGSGSSLKAIHLCAEPSC